VQELKKLLAPIFEKMSDRIAVAYLFGSAANGEAGPGSDIDLAVLLHDPAGSAGFEVRLDLYADCSRVLKRNDIDVVVLNTARNLFLLNDVVQKGIVLYQCDSELREEFEVKIVHDFIDFRDGRKRKNGVERIRHKIGRIREHLALLRSIKDQCTERFVAAPIYRGALLHYLYLLSDSCIVLAEMVIKHRGLRISQSYAENFDILGESDILDRKFAYEFARIAGFRNFLSHDYEKVAGVFVCGQILARLDDVDSYIDQIKKSLEL